MPPVPETSLVIRYNPSNPEAKAAFDALLHWWREGEITVQLESNPATIKRAAQEGPIPVEVTSPMMPFAPAPIKFREFT